MQGGNFLLACIETATTVKEFVEQTTEPAPQIPLSLDLGLLTWDYQLQTLTQMAYSFVMRKPLYTFCLSSLPTHS